LLNVIKFVTDVPLTLSNAIKKLLFKETSFTPLSLAIVLHHWL